MVVVKASVELATRAEVIVVWELVRVVDPDEPVWAEPDVAVVPAAADVPAAELVVVAPSAAVVVVVASALVGTEVAWAVVVVDCVVSWAEAVVLEDDVGSSVVVAWVEDVAADVASGVLGAALDPDASCRRWKKPMA